MQALKSLRRKLEGAVRTAPFLLSATADFLKTAKKEDIALFIGANTYGVMILVAILTLEGHYIEGIVASLFFLFMIFLLNVYCIYDKAILLRHFDENPELFHQSYEEANQSVIAEREGESANLLVSNESDGVFGSTNLALRGAICSKKLKSVRDFGHQTIFDDEPGK